MSSYRRNNWFADIDGIRLIRESDRAFWTMTALIAIVLLVLALTFNVVMSRTDYYGAAISGHIAQCHKQSNEFLLALILLSTVANMSAIATISLGINYMNWHRFVRGKSAANRYMTSSTKGLLCWATVMLTGVIALTWVVLAC